MTCIAAKTSLLASKVVSLQVRIYLLHCVEIQNSTAQKRAKSMIGNDHANAKNPHSIQHSKGRI